jgi:hypothetical protein
MNYRTNQYVEISGEIESKKRFCEFLVSGGKVLDLPSETWRDVTVQVMDRERRTIAELERVRSVLYPDLIPDTSSSVGTH